MGNAQRMLLRESGAEIDAHEVRFGCLGWFRVSGFQGLGLWGLVQVFRFGLGLWVWVSGFGFLGSVLWGWSGSLGVGSPGDVRNTRL